MRIYRDVYPHRFCTPLVFDRYLYVDVDNLLNIPAALCLEDKLFYTVVVFIFLCYGKIDIVYGEQRQCLNLSVSQVVVVHRYPVAVHVGHADTDVPGSWNAFADYKYFEHGSFFGGNGTESLPDRYLDGIKSFTIGGGYVPAKDFLIEAFYTFGAKGIGKRDTLYGSENFELGDYTRLQVTYKF